MMRALLFVVALGCWAAPRDGVLRGEVVDADSGKPIPCRISIRGIPNGTFYFAKSAAADGTAIEYKKVAIGNPKISENHVTLSAHPFTVDVPPGRTRSRSSAARSTAPRRSEVRRRRGAKIEFKLQRWINMAERGWYSGETHVHRMPDQLPNLMLAEDLNVALPFTSWVVEAYKSPKGANKAAAAAMNDARVVEVDKTHVFYPRNTSTRSSSSERRSTRWARSSSCNHKTLFEEGLPPVRPDRPEGPRRRGRSSSSTSTTGRGR
jgi:hypothetical protein